MKMNPKFLDTTSPPPSNDEIARAKSWMGKFTGKEVQFTFKDLTDRDIVEIYQDMKKAFESNQETV